LTTETLLWSAGTQCTIIMVSELKLNGMTHMEPGLLGTALRPDRTSTPATRMFSGPLDGVPAVPR